MANVQQSGNITPGHLVNWTAPGVIGDAGPLGAMQKVLQSIRSANFNTTSDQPIILPQAIAAFTLTGIIVTNASVSLTTAQGGIYTAASKGGSAIVASSQAYTSLTTPNVLLNLTLASGVVTTRYSSSNLSVSSFGGLAGLALYLSLTIAQGVAATADVYLIGIDLT